MIRRHGWQSLRPVRQLPAEAKRIQEAGLNDPIAYATTRVRSFMLPEPFTPQFLTSWKLSVCALGKSFSAAIPAVIHRLDAAQVWSLPTTAVMRPEMICVISIGASTRAPIGSI